MYADWLVEFRERFHTYATFTFPDRSGWSSRLDKRYSGRLKTYNNISPETALKKGKVLRYMVNYFCSGRRFRENKTGILSVVAVEVRGNRPHLHTLWEYHPLITPAFLKTLWRKVLNRWLSSRAIDVRNIRDLVKVTRYTTKHITWENSPHLDIWIPQRPWQDDMLELRLGRFKAGVAERCSVNGV